MRNPMPWMMLGLVMGLTLASCEAKERVVERVVESKPVEDRRVITVTDATESQAFGMFPNGTSPRFYVIGDGAKGRMNLVVFRPVEIGENLVVHVVRNPMDRSWLRQGYEFVLED